MQGIGILFIHLLYLIFFIGYFIYSYTLHKKSVLPYFLISTFILVIEFFSLSGNHQTFIFFILFNFIYIIYRLITQYLEQDLSKKNLLYLPLYALVPFIFIFFIKLLAILKIAFPYIITNIYFQVSLLVFLILIIILKYTHLLNWRRLFLFILLYFIGAFPIIKIKTENDIKNIALKKFNKVPICLNINFNIHSEFRSPHALIKKFEKYYYWSFRENNFIENNRIQGC